MPENQAETILNVNDDEATRYVVSRVLRLAGFHVVEAATGQEALEQARSAPDLIVLDVNLPDMSGIEVCREIKTDPATFTIPVLHLSASRIHADDRVEGLESGADGYLTQPIEPQELTSTVRALLRLSHAEERSRRSAQEWEAVFNGIADGVCVVGLDGRIQRCNRAWAALVDTPFEAAPGTAYADILDLLMQPGSALLPSGKVPLGTGRVWEVQTGAGRWLRITTEPVRNVSSADGTMTAVVQVFSDITTEKEAENRQHILLSDILASVTEGRLRLCWRRENLPAPLDTVGEPIILTRQSIRELRRLVEQACVANGFPDERWQDLVTAVGEAAMNAVTHGGETKGQARVCVDTRGTVQVWIEDNGAGISLNDLHRATLERGFTTTGTLGHGFWMMLKTSDRVWLLTGASGTTVVLEQEKAPPGPEWLTGFAMAPSPERASLES